MRFLSTGVLTGLVVTALLVSGAGAASAESGTPASGSATAPATSPGEGAPVEGASVDGGAVIGSEETPATTAPATTAPTPTARAAATAVANPAASVVTLTPGLTGFDNIAADSGSQLRCLSDAGYSFDVLDALTAGWDTEYRAAAAIGMSVVLFQGFYQPYWSDPNQGTARGQLMVTNAQSVGYPQGAQVFLNLENNLTDGTNPVSRATMIQWVQNWVAAVSAAGYVPGIYVGAPQLLTTADLDSALPQSVVFWRSASGSAPQTSKGYVMRQPTINTSVCNTTTDIDTSSSDNRGAALVGAGFPRAATTPAVPGAIGPLTPARIFDTRGTATLPANGISTVQILGAGGIPPTNVSAVVLNITVVNPAAGGYLTAWPSDQPQPYASNLNFTPGQTVPNLVVVPVGNNGTIKIYNGSAGNVDVLADVAGYYLGGTPTAAGALGPLTPSRIFDTRGAGTLPANGISTVQILGAGGIPPTNVSAVVLNITVVNPAAGGYLTAWPSDQPQPYASNLNFAPGQTVPNLVVVPVGTDGTIKIYNGSAGNVDVLADVAGYYLGGTPTAAGTLGPLTPARILDTRGTATLPAQAGRALRVFGKGGVPVTGVSAVIMNVTTVGPAAGGFLTAWPSGANQPIASNLNFVPGQTVANLVVVPVGTDGSVMLYNGSPGPADLLADVVGYIKS